MQLNISHLNFSDYAFDTVLKRVIFGETTFRYPPRLLSQIIQDSEERKRWITQCNIIVILSLALAKYRRMNLALVPIYRERMNHTTPLRYVQRLLFCFLKYTEKVCATLLSVTKVNSVKHTLKSVILSSPLEEERKKKKEIALSYNFLSLEWKK